VRFIQPPALPPRSALTVCFEGALKSNEQNVVNTWFVESPVKSEDIKIATAPSTPAASPGFLYEKASQLIQNADGILIVAGAGIGVDSGLPGTAANDLTKTMPYQYPALA